jgi:hypothetical protein
LYFSCQLLHRWENIGESPVQIVWAIIPPHF